MLFKTFLSHYRVHPPPLVNPSSRPEVHLDKSCLDVQELVKEIRTSQRGVGEEGMCSIKIPFIQQKGSNA